MSSCLPLRPSETFLHEVLMRKFLVEDTSVCQLHTICEHLEQRPCWSHETLNNTLFLICLIMLNNSKHLHVNVASASWRYYPDGHIFKHNSGLRAPTFYANDTRYQAENRQKWREANMKCHYLLILLESGAVPSSTKPLRSFTAKQLFPKQQKKIQGF